MKKYSPDSGYLKRLLLMEEKIHFKAHQRLDGKKKDQTKGYYTISKHNP
jgi:hypothetical protein